MLTRLIITLVILNAFLLIALALVFLPLSSDSNTDAKALILIGASENSSIVEFRVQLPRVRRLGRFTLGPRLQDRPIELDSFWFSKEETDKVSVSQYFWSGKSSEAVTLSVTKERESDIARAIVCTSIPVSIDSKFYRITKVTKGGVGEMDSKMPIIVSGIVTLNLNPVRLENAVQKEER